MLDFTVNPGNEHDSRTFKGLYDKIKDIGVETIVADAGYKTPAIVVLLPLSLIGTIIITVHACNQARTTVEHVPGQVENLGQQEMIGRLNTTIDMIQEQNDKLDSIHSEVRSVNSKVNWLMWS